MCPDIMSTGFSGAERGGVRISGTVIPVYVCPKVGYKAPLIPKGW